MEIFLALAQVISSGEAQGSVEHFIFLCYTGSLILLFELLQFQILSWFSDSQFLLKSLVIAEVRYHISLDLN